MAYADLLADVADTLDRDDVATRLPRWLKRVEARLNRLLHDPEQQVVTTLTGDGASLPADFGEMIAIGTADGNRLSPMGNQEYAAILAQSGTSRYYVIRESKVYYAPGAANPTLVYYRSIPPLTEDDDTNWLLERAYDVYWHGVLAHGYDWDQNDAKAQAHKDLWDAAIAELIGDGARRKWGAGPIAPRIRRA